LLNVSSLSVFTESLIVYGLPFTTLLIECISSDFWICYGRGSDGVGKVFYSRSREKKSLSQIPFQEGMEKESKITRDHRLKDELAAIKSAQLIFKSTLALLAIEDADRRRKETEYLENQAADYNKNSESLMNQIWTLKLKVLQFLRGPSNL
jgi:hypothetical protein